MSDLFYNLLWACAALGAAIGVVILALVLVLLVKFGIQELKKH